MEALAKQQQQIEERIPDQSYYQSEEFHALLTLILEKLHSTHQQEKLKTFVDNLINWDYVLELYEQMKQYLDAMRMSHRFTGPDCELVHPRLMPRCDQRDAPSARALRLEVQR